MIFSSGKGEFHATQKTIYIVKKNGKNRTNTTLETRFMVGVWCGINYRHYCAGNLSRHAR